MADGFEFTVDVASILSLVDRVGASAEFHVRDVARETANLVIAEARARMGRAAHPTGETIGGLSVEMLKGTQLGYAVVQAANTGKLGQKVPRFLEHGTRHMMERPYFDAAAELEQGGHLRRMEERLAQVAQDLER